MTEPAQLREALAAADGLISRVEELIADRLARPGDFDEREAFYRIVEVLETAPEVAKVRIALGQDPHRFGAPTPLAAGDKTG